MINNFTKILQIGTVKIGERFALIYCEIKYCDGNLSISGVVGPLKSGNCLGGCGQINMNFQYGNSIDESLIKPNEITYARGWNAEKWLDFLDIWEKWHLNDMRSDCVHQRMENWGTKELTVVKVKNQIWRAIGNKNYEELKSAFNIIETHYKKDKDIPTSIIQQYTHSACRAYIFAIQDASKGKVYIPHKDSMSATWIGENKPIEIVAEKKLSSWVYPYEHPEGVLTKPCPVCGYKYGTAWLKENVPDAVINFLLALPDTDKTPAWI